MSTENMHPVAALAYDWWQQHPEHKRTWEEFLSLVEFFSESYAGEDHVRIATEAWEQVPAWQKKQQEQRHEQQQQ